MCDLHKRSFVECIAQNIFSWDTFSTQDLLWKVSHKRFSCGIPSPQKIFCGRYASTSLFLYIWHLPQKILCGEGIPQQHLLWDTFHKRSFVEGVPLHLSFYIYIYMAIYTSQKKQYIAPFREIHGAKCIARFCKIHSILSFHSRQMFFTPISSTKKGKIRVSATDNP